MLPSQSFLFLRHGQTDWNVDGRFQGHADIVLNATGLSQAHDAAARMTSLRVDTVVASPLLRALKTAAIVAEGLGLPVHVDSELRERTFGAFEGLVVDEVKRQHGLRPDQPAKSILPADAEQWPDTVRRSGAATAKWLGAHPDRNVLFVAHDGIFRALTEILAIPGFASRNATPYRFRCSPEGWSVEEAF